MKKLILASKSPRRKELLEKCGIPFSVDAAEIDETLNPALPLSEAIMDLSVRKASAVLKRHPDAVVLGSDTIVVADGEILGKPKDRADAVRMLRDLSGREHAVVTAVTLRDSRREETFSDTTLVWFKELSDSEIDYYIDNFRPFDKAGAYGVQEWIGYIGITRLEGSYFNVVGFPVQRVYEALLRFLLPA